MPPVRLWAGLFLAAAALCGCGGPATYPAEGKLVWPDGTPVTELTGGTVVFESAELKVSASGDIRPDGTFQLSTYKENDGAPAGKYRVIVQQPLEEGKDRPPPRIIPERFERFDQSGLEATVEAKSNTYTFTLERVGKKGKR